MGSRQRMQIDREALERLAAQFHADCGGQADQEKRFGKRVRLYQGPRFPQRGGMSEEAYGEWQRELLQGRGGTVPRVYEGMDLFFRGIVCAGQAWIMADGRIWDWCVEEYLEKGGRPEWFWQFSDLSRLERMLARYDRQIADVRLHFLPAGEEGKDQEEAERALPFEPRLFEGEKLWGLREKTGFRHALCGSGLSQDRLAVAAVCRGEIVGMAGAAQDCPAMWQIGVDVKEGWEGKGIGAGLVRLVKKEVAARGAIPFYGTSQSHIVSINTALAAGFLPAWSEVYCRRKSGCDEIRKKERKAPHGGYR